MGFLNQTTHSLIGIVYRGVPLTVVGKLYPVNMFLQCRVQTKTEVREHVQILGPSIRSQSGIDSLCFVLMI
jgi:hypothetical protein